MNYVLGTVQFGLKYGYYHNNNPVNEDDIEKIIKISEINKVNELDTANTYGKSESILSKKITNKKNWKFNTKIRRSFDDIINEDYLDFIKKEINDSFNRFNSLNIIYIHNPKDLFKQNADKIFYFLENLKKNNIISKIGCSLYNEKEITHAISNYNFDNLQIPISILDQRLLHSNILNKIKQKKIEIYARSIFLQGALLNNLSEISSNINSLYPYIMNFREISDKYKMKYVELALNFVRSIKQIDKIILGVQNFNQYKMLLNLPFTKIDLELFSSLNCKNEKLIDLRNWK